MCWDLKRGIMMKEKDMFKKTEQRLYEYKLLKGRIKMLENKKKIISLEEDGVKAIEYSDMPKGTGFNNQGMEKLIIKREREYNRIDREIEITELKINDIDIALDLMDKEEVKIFNAKYMSTEKKTVARLTRDLHMDKSTFNNKKNSLVIKAMQVIF